MATTTKKILIVAPHGDDEVLGCGGTIFRELALGSEVHVLIMTKGYEAQGFSKSSLEQKELEMESIIESIPYSTFARLDFPAVGLETIPRSELVKAIHNHIQELQPECLYIPFKGDVHTDHQVVAEAAWAAAKAFRAPSVKEVYAYEVPSETGYQTPGSGDAFEPNTFVDITDTLDQKVDAFKLYQSELQEFPFPRSEQVLRALALLRGSLVHVTAAEAFICLRSIK